MGLRPDRMPDVVALSLGFALAQHGVVSRSQLIDSGISSGTISSRIARSFLFPVFPGVYVVGRAEITQEGLWAASLLSTGMGAVLGGRAAATVWGFMDERNNIDVLRIGGGSNQRPEVKVKGTRGWPYVLVRKVRSISSPDRTYVNGLAVTSVARTLLDLAELLPERRFRHAFTEADRLGLIVEEDLLEIRDRVQGRCGGRIFRRVVEERIPNIGRARSLLEGIFLELERDSRIPQPEVNVPVLGFEADFVWNERRVIVEVDGYEFHRGKESFENDAWRSNRLRSEGWTLLRFTWRMLNRDPAEVSAQISKVLVDHELAVK